MANDKTNAKPIRTANIILLLILIGFELFFGGPRIFNYIGQGLSWLLPVQFQVAQFAVSVFLIVKTLLGLFITYIFFKCLMNRLIGNDVFEKYEILFMVLIQSLVANLIGYFWSYMGIDNTALTPLLISNIANTITLFLIPNIFLYLKTKKYKLTRNQIIKFNVALLVYSGAATLLNGLVDLNQFVLPRLVRFFI